MHLPGIVRVLIEQQKISPLEAQEEICGPIRHLKNSVSSSVIGMAVGVLNSTQVATLPGGVVNHNIGYKTLARLS